MDKKETIETIYTKDLDMMNYKKIYGILIGEFPYGELRSFNSQCKAFRHPEYRISFIPHYREDGFVLWWSFHDFIFVEYVFVKREKRYCGIGTGLLDGLKTFHKIIVLEVDTEEKMVFYKKAGFVYNNVDYNAISINEMKPLTYQLMSYDHKLSDLEYKHFINKIKEQEYQF